VKTSLNQSVVAFIGGGNMARSLIGGLVRQGQPPLSLRVVEPDGARAQALRDEYGVQIAPVAAAAVRGARAVVLAVKPQQMREALDGVVLDEGATVVSIAAGVRLDTLRRWLAGDAHFVRTMPNTPALLSQGITALYAPPETPEEARVLATSILSAAGQTVWIEREEDLDAVTALSGSGPAYYFLLTEVLRQAGEALGLSPETAAQLAKQTFVGAAAMAAGDTDVTTLRANVTSKGGTTDAAVKHLEAAGIRGLFTAALEAAARRSAELGTELERN
jgi:pyrroline-5-carboxylate reductase